jgi:hypothetical protein
LAEKMAEKGPAQAEDFQITVDLMKPEEAPQVSELFRTVYGDGYPVKTYYNSEELAQANQEGSVISSVARTTDGKVVGHNALFHSAPGADICESGAGLVHPEFRVGNLFNRMVAHGVEVGAPLFGVKAVFFEPVSNHVFSQKLCHSQGYLTCAIEVDLMPAAAYTKEKSAPGRVSALLDFEIIEPLAHRAYLPGSYALQLRELYQELKDERELTESPAGRPEDGQTRLDVNYFEYARVARLALWEVGADLATRLDRELSDLRGKGAEVIQVWVNLASPWTGHAVDELRKQGFFFGGLLPRWFDTDGMLMQWVAAPPDWEGMNLLFPRGQHLRELAQQDWSRTA